jgi:hypothetical protein
MKDLLDRMEISYREKCSGNLGNNGIISYPGIFDRINAARIIDDKTMLRTFLDELSNDIQRNCQLLYRENVAELETHSQQQHSAAHRVATSDPAAGDGTSLKEDPAASDTDEGTGSPSPDESEDIPISSRPNTPSTSQSCKANLRAHEYTSKLWILALESGGEPVFDYGGGPNAWTCEASFDGCRGKGFAKKKKDAQHLASKMLFQVLENRKKPRL